MPIQSRKLKMRTAAMDIIHLFELYFIMYLGHYYIIIDLEYRSPYKSINMVNLCHIQKITVNFI